jgi:FAD/FMN-containing dehydrogenase
MIGDARVDTTGAAAWSRRNLLQAGLAAAAGMAAPALAADAAAGDLAGLSRQVRGRFLTSADSGYDDARRVWNKVYDRRPLAMARCADVDDVRRCVEFGRRHALPVAIRGGGHSYAGWGVADGALQVDLGMLDTVTIDAQRRVASVGGGARIKQLLAASYAQGLITPMGACGEVGVAGLALAGGDTAARGLFGTACDNIIGAQMVTADGDVLELGPDRNADLFWAIRGGGGNFGVVTRLDLQLHPILPSHNLGFRFGWSDIGAAMRVFGELMRTAPDHVRMGFSVEPAAGAAFGCRVYGSEAMAADYFATLHKAFPRAESRSSPTRLDPVGEVWETTNLAVDAAFLEGVDDALAAVLERAALGGRGFGAILMGLSNGKAARIGMTETAYPLRGTGLSSMISAEWHRPEDRDRAVNWVAEHGAALRPWARRAYVNYLPPSSPDRIREVYGVNHPRLAAIKARFDPDNLFRSNQNILPVRSA